MKRTIPTEKLLIGILLEQEAGGKDADLCRKNGMFKDTFQP